MVEIGLERIRRGSARGRASVDAGGGLADGALGHRSAGPHAGRLAPGQQIFHPADDDLRLERLDEDAVAADRPRAGLVDRLERAGQQHDGNVRQRGIALDEGRHFVAVALRHPDVREHDVGTIALDAIDRLLTVSHGDDLDVFVRERQLDDALDRDAVIRQQELVRHGYHDTLSGHSRMAPKRPSARAVLVTLLDAALVIAASAAVVIALGGRSRFDVAGVRVTLRAASNALVLAAAFGALRLWLGRGLRPLPAIARPDDTCVDTERQRFASPAPPTPAVWLYWAAALLGSLVWVVPHLLNIRHVPDAGDPIFSASP